MIQILLIIAIVIAILLDVIRICQYIGMRKLLDEYAKFLAKKKFEERLKKIVDKWRNDKMDVSRIEDYIIKHWEDEQ